MPPPGQIDTRLIPNTTSIVNALIHAVLHRHSRISRGTLSIALQTLPALWFLVRIRRSGSSGWGFRVGDSFVECSSPALSAYIAHDSSSRELWLRSGLTAACARCIFGMLGLEPSLYEVSEASGFLFNEIGVLGRGEHSGSPALSTQPGWPWPYNSLPETYGKA